MKNKIMKFIDETFGSVRGVYLNDQPWLYAKDVCKVLKVGRVEKALARLEADEWQAIESKSPTSLNKGNRGSIKKTWLVSEAGFYSLVFTSRTPEAKEFKRWVCHEVLPEIRRTGEYHSVWEEAREGGKDTRRKLTDAIKIFCEYLERRGELDRPLGTWIIIFSKQVNKILGITDERNDLNAKKLFELDTCEKICAKAIEEGMQTGKSHHDIWIACNEKLNAWKELTS